MTRERSDRDVHVRPERQARRARRGAPWRRPHVQIARLASRPGTRQIARRTPASASARAAGELGLRAAARRALVEVGGESNLDLDQEFHGCTSAGRRVNSPVCAIRPERKDRRMATVTFKDTTRIYPKSEAPRGRPAQPRDRGRRVSRARRTVGLRQDDEPAHARRPRGRRRGDDPDRRQGRRERRSARAATSRWCSRTTRSTRT